MSAAPPLVDAADIRRAQSSHLAWLVGELRAFARLYPLERSLFPEDEADVRALLGALITDGILLVATRFVAAPTGGRRELAGFIGGYWHPHLYNGALHVLTETFWWTTPSARSAGVGQQLLDEFVAQGHAGGADVVSMTVLPGRTPPAVEDTLVARGFTLAERVYVLETASRSETR